MKEMKLVLKKVGSIGLALVVLSTVFAGMSQAASSETVNWKWNFYCANMEEEPVAKAYATQVIPRVKQRTNGKFNITPYWGKALGIKAMNYPPALASNAIQMAWTFSGYYAGDIPIIGAASLPMLTSSIEEYKGLSDITRKYYEKAYRNAYKGKVEIVAVSPYNWSEFVTTKPLVKNTDFSGMKIRVPDKMFMKWIGLLGGVGLTTSWSEMVPALHQGVVDGVGTAFESMTKAKLYEICKYVYLYDFGSGENHVIASSKALEALPQDYKNILLEELSKTDSYNWKCLIPVNEEHKKAIQLWKENGAEIIELTSAERKEVRDKTRPIWEDWEEKIGSDASEILKQFFVKFGH